MSACSDDVNLSAVIAGLDPAIPIMWHSRALASGMAESSPAMTNSIPKDIRAPANSTRNDGVVRLRTG
jgi:hypothetical protein